MAWDGRRHEPGLTELIMAYLDLNAAHPFETNAAHEARAKRKLDAQERLVVLLSRKDPLWSLNPPRGGSRLLRLVLGIEAPHRLADGRLEALRRYAVTYRLRDAAVAAAEGEAAEMGFTEHALAQVRHMLDGARALPPQPTIGIIARRGFLLSVFALIFVDLLAWLSPRFDSTLIAFVLVAISAVSFAPFLGDTDTSRRLR